MGHKKKLLRTFLSTSSCIRLTITVHVQGLSVQVSFAGLNYINGDGNWYPPQITPLKTVIGKPLYCLEGPTVHLDDMALFPCTTFKNSRRRRTWDWFEGLGKSYLVVNDDNKKNISGFSKFVAVKTLQGEKHPENHLILYWLVVSTHLKNISQIGNLPQIGVKIKNL